LVKPAQRERDKKTIQLSIREALAKIPGITYKVGNVMGFRGGAILISRSSAMTWKHPES